MIYAPDYHDIGFQDAWADSIQIYTSKFTEILEDEIILAISEVLNVMNMPFLKEAVSELIEEKKNRADSVLTQVLR